MGDHFAALVAHTFSCLPKELFLEVGTHFGESFRPSEGTDETCLGARPLRVFYHLDVRLGVLVAGEQARARLGLHRQLSPSKIVVALGFALASLVMNFFNRFCSNFYFISETSFMQL